MAQRTIERRTPGISVPQLPGIPGVATLGRLLRNPSVIAGLVILLPLVFLAVFRAQLPFSDPLKPNVLHSLEGMSSSHLFGTDKLGRDVFSRSVEGLRVSLTVGFGSAGIALAGGILLGTCAGFMGKGVDRVISALVDILLSFPSLLLAIGVVAVFGAGTPQVIAALSIAGTPGAIRLQRALALGLRSRTYMDAARMANAPVWWMLVRHVMPNTVAPMVVYAAIFTSNAILVEASLSFLGLGIVPPEPSLGNLVSDGRPYLQNAWWISTMPGLMLAVVSVSLHLISDGLREELDPRTRKGE